MTEAEKEPIYVEKLTNSDTKGLEGNSKAANDDLIEPTSAETKALLRKMDKRIVPLVCLIYLFSFLGRLDYGRKLTMPPSYFNDSISSMICLVAYFLFEIPSNLILKRMGPSKWIPIVMLIRASTMFRMAATTSLLESMILRFVLILSETSLFSGFNFCFSLWYPRKEQVERVETLLNRCMAGSYIVDGIITIGIMQFHRLCCLCGQKSIFYITYIPALLLVALCYFGLPDEPKNFKFLTEHERTILHRLRADMSNAEEPGLVWKPFGISISDPNLYTHSMAYICSTTPSYNMLMGLPFIGMIGGFNFIHLNAWPMPLTAPICALACFTFGEMILHLRKEDSIEEHENTV